MRTKEIDEHMQKIGKYNDTLCKIINDLANMFQVTYVIFYCLYMKPFTHVHASFKGKRSSWMTVSTFAFYWFHYSKY